MVPAILCPFVVFRPLVSRLGPGVVATALIEGPRLQQLLDNETSACLLVQLGLFQGTCSQ